MIKMMNIILISSIFKEIPINRTNIVFSVRSLNKLKTIIREIRELGFYLIYLSYTISLIRRM